MILFGINFNIYYLLLLKKIKAIWKNEEVRTYLGVILGATALITANLVKTYGTVLKAFRYAVFQVASIITTTGFATADFDQWPEFSKYILLALMVIGACAGSTGGGMKVARIIILLKSVKREMKRLLHPKSVNLVKISGKKIKEETLQGVYVYFIAYVAIFIVSLLLISFNDFDFVTNFSGVLTTMNNVGPGLQKIGPMYNFSEFSAFSKVVFAFDMLIGRLEIFPFMMLFSPNLWRKKF